ncbi:MAG: YcxB family protein [Acetivibrio ethanolgignens]
MDYIVQIRRDTRLLKAFIKFTNRVRHPRVTVYMITIGATLLALPFVNHEIETIGVVICYVLGALMLIMGLFRHYISLYLMKNNPQTRVDEEFIYQFGNAEIQVENRGITQSLGSYKKIYRLWEDEKHFYIGMNEDDLLVLPKKAFKAGNAGTFRDYVLERSKAGYTWQPTRMDHIIKNNVLQFKMKMEQ